VALYGITILPLLHILPSSFMPEDQHPHNVPTTDACTISCPAWHGRGIVQSTLGRHFWFFLRLWRSG
jgi:hypothetical protein